jgi:hypothetical protein
MISGRRDRRPVRIMRRAAAITQWWARVTSRIRVAECANPACAAHAVARFSAEMVNGGT